MAGLRMGLRWEEATTTDHPASLREDGIEELHLKTGWMDGGDGSVGLPGSQDLLDLRGLQCPVWPEIKMPEWSEPMSVRLVIRAVGWGSWTQWYKSVPHSQTWGALSVQQLLPPSWNHSHNIGHLKETYNAFSVCCPSLSVDFWTFKTFKHAQSPTLASPTEHAAPEAPETT